jgi:thiol-disulfide isomerase/thioredoxin
LYVPEIQGRRMAGPMASIVSGRGGGGVVKHAMVEFYAPWCPHCQTFAPTMERLGHAVNSDDTSPVLLARVNCVRQRPLCVAWGIRSFPTLLAGAASAFQDSENRAEAGRAVQEVPRGDAGAIARWIASEWGVPEPRLDPPEAFHRRIADLIRSRQTQQQQLLLLQQPSGSSPAGAAVSSAPSQVVDRHDVELAFATAVAGMLRQLEAVLRRVEPSRTTLHPEYRVAWKAAHAFSDLLARLPATFQRCRDSIAAVSRHLMAVRDPQVRARQPYQRSANVSRSHFPRSCCHPITLQLRSE